MKTIELSIALAALLAAAPLAAHAQESRSPLTWEITAVSDYVFHGVSQSDENPTAQAGLTYTAQNGLYAGAWASGVDFGSNKPDFQVDAFVGYKLDFSDAVGFDARLKRYHYPDAGARNFNELVTTTTFLKQYSLTVAYTNDGGGSDTDVWYYRGSASWPLSNDYSLNALVGRTDFRENAVIGSRDYTDWGVGVSKRWGMVKASLDFYGTDGNGRDNAGRLADNRLVLTVGVGN